MIFLVEDDENISELCAYALKGAGYESEAFEKGATFFSRLEESLPKLVLLDVMLPDMTGFEVLKRLKSRSKTRDIPVLMLTAKTGEYDKVKGLDLGADDYMTKPFGVLELISRIKAILRRSIPKEEQSLSLEGIYVDRSSHVVTVDDKVVPLTLKEFELLACFIQNRGIALSRDRLMEKVWGFDFEGESRTVDMHVKTLRQKLGEKGGLIQTIRGVGYKI